MSARLAREIAALERTNALLRAALSQRPTRLPRWAIVLLVVEALVACGGSPLAARLGAAIGRASADALDVPIGGPSDGLPSYCLRPPAQRGAR